jgi:translation initiation factor RLI1
LGGLIQNNETQKKYKVPILGDIPLLGFLFRNSIKSLTKSNLVIYVTPHILKPNNPLDLDSVLRRYNLNNIDYAIRKTNESLKKAPSAPQAINALSDSSAQKPVAQANEKKDSPSEKSPADSTTLEKNRSKASHADAGAAADTAQGTKAHAAQQEQGQPQPKPQQNSNAR